ncbi:MAG: hypothetical protein JNL90_09515 [Planctomycetes bacterium]|nr:hypothetical protein [Planctomycetota bacterium]
MAACSGGGGGAGSPGSSSASFQLEDAKYGRLVDDGTTESLVSPLTTAQIDPLTGVLVPGTLKALGVGVDVEQPQSLGLGTSYLPRVIPRNGVIQLEFSAPIAASSVSGDVIDANGALVTAGSVQLRLADDTPIPAEVRLVGGRTIWINPAANGQIGLPASPVDFGPDGAPRADATGYIKLRLPRTGSAILRSTNGAFLGKRDDGLGDTATPIGLNPGNRVLDFIAQNQLIPTNETFNGFLPDTSIPRIVRTYEVARTFDVVAGDTSTATTLTDVDSVDNTTAKGGLGEWSGANLVLRPGTGSEETLTVASNDGDTLTLATAFTLAPQDGDAYALRRTEYFEPELTDPIDDDLFDPDNPENVNNKSLANFVEVWEIDAAGNALAGPTNLRTSVPAFSELRVRFNEPMAADSFLQWESFRVSANPDGGEGQELLTDVFLDSTQTIATIRPARVDQVAGTSEVIGWGKSTKNLQLAITTIPRATFLQQFLNTTEYDDFVDLGYRGVLDLGGQPLGFSVSQFDPASPRVRYFAAFTSAESASTQPVPPVVNSWGVIVHRMRGRPVTGLDPATGNPGVGFRDQVNYYLPIADVNLQTNGLLAGSPVVFITKIHDEFFPPPVGQFSKLFNGLPEPITSNLTAQNQAHDGARFQVVFRDIDCSPNSLGLAGTLLDLYRVSWAPIGGNVSTDNYDDISIHCAHSPIRPNSANDTAAATYPQSGLSIPFDLQTWIDDLDGGTNPCPSANCTLNDAPNYWDTLVTVVQPGTSYRISQGSIFTPPFDGNAWHPWPVFTTRFQYNNGDIPTAESDLLKSINTDYDCSGGNPWVDYRDFSSDPFVDNKGGDSLLFEVRIRPQQTTITGQNGFSYVIGCLIDAGGKPNWRAHSEGSPTSRLQPDNINGAVAARCASGNATSSANPIKVADSSRYLGVFDYVKTTSRITSPYVRVFPTNTLLPDYYPAIVSPPASAQPAGTSITLEFEGATGIKGSGGTGFSTNIDVADTKQNIAFRATLVGNISTLLLPNCETVAIPYLRPSGT